MVGTINSALREPFLCLVAACSASFASNLLPTCPFEDDQATILAVLKSSSCCVQFAGLRRMRAFSKFGNWIKGKKETMVLLVGLSGAGKTTLLYESWFVEEVHTIPTVAFNVEKIDHNGHRFIVWDMGGEGTCNAISTIQLTIMQAPS
jgi:hypothetical protein